MLKLSFHYFPRLFWFKLIMQFDWKSLKACSSEQTFDGEFIILFGGGQGSFVATLNALVCLLYV